MHSPLWKITHQSPSVSCTPPCEKSPIKSHRFCVLPPLRNHCFWWALISAKTVFFDNNRTRRIGVISGGYRSGVWMEYWRVWNDCCRVCRRPAVPSSSLLPFRPSIWPDAITLIGRTKRLSSIYSWSGPRTVLAYPTLPRWMRKWLIGEGWTSGCAEKTDDLIWRWRPWSDQFAVIVRGKFESVSVYFYCQNCFFSRWKNLYLKSSVLAG